jgi:hypothetical protein
MCAASSREDSAGVRPSPRRQATRVGTRDPISELRDVSTLPGRQECDRHLGGDPRLQQARERRLLILVSAGAEDRGHGWGGHGPIGQHQLPQSHPRRTAGPAHQRHAEQHKAGHGLRISVGVLHRHRTTLGGAVQAHPPQFQVRDETGKHVDVGGVRHVFAVAVRQTAAPAVVHHHGVLLCEPAAEPAMPVDLPHRLEVAHQRRHQHQRRTAADSGVGDACAVGGGEKVDFHDATSWCGREARG